MKAKQGIFNEDKENETLIDDLLNKIAEVWLQLY